MIDPRSFRQTMSCFATGVTVVTTRNEEGAAVGFTVNSLASVSLTPPLVSFCIDKRAHLFSTFRKADMFAVNILSDEQENLSQHFADYRHHPAPKKIWGIPQHDCPLLKHTLGWMVCRKTATYKGGDHVILLGEVVKLHKRATDANPLLYFHSRYRRIKD